MNHHGKHVDDGRARDEHADDEAIPSEHTHPANQRPDNPLAEPTDRQSPYTHDGGVVGGGVGATHDGGVVGGAGREGDVGGSGPPDAQEPGAGVDYRTGHGQRPNPGDGTVSDANTADAD